MSACSEAPSCNLGNLDGITGKSMITANMFQSVLPVSSRLCCSITISAKSSTLVFFKSNTHCNGELLLIQNSSSMPFSCLYSLENRYDDLLTFPHRCYWAHGGHHSSATHRLMPIVQPAVTLTVPPILSLCLTIEGTQQINWFIIIHHFSIVFQKLFHHIPTIVPSFFHHVSIICPSFLHHCHLSNMLPSCSITFPSFFH